MRHELIKLHGEFAELRPLLGLKKEPPLGPGE